MQKQQRHAIKQEGNIIYLMEGFRKEKPAKREHQPAAPVISKEYARKPSDNSANSSEQKEYAKEARLAESKGELALKERICSTGISHYSSILKSTCSPNSKAYATNRERLDKSAELLKDISELFGIWGFEKQQKSYEELSSSIKLLASEVR